LAGSSGWPTLKPSTRDPPQRCLRDGTGVAAHLCSAPDREQAYEKVRLGIEQPAFLF